MDEVGEREKRKENVGREKSHHLMDAAQIGSHVGPAGHTSARMTLATRLKMILVFRDCSKSPEKEWEP